MTDINVSVVILGKSKPRFIVEGHAPTMVRTKHLTRGVLKPDGRIYISADFPVAGFYPDPESILMVEVK